ncbi:MAG: dephospho-CoA kinase [Coriobacteriia bacterium]|nr:dephospho-CoA kinase [Coriobacteriia bacterium]
MKIIALTGPFGAGKTTLVQLLAAQLRSSGATVSIIALDEVSRAVIDADAHLRAELARAFGKDILHTDGSLDRRALAHAAFASDAATAQLNALVHPPTIKRAGALLAHAATSSDLAIIESPFPLSYLAEIITGVEESVQIWTVSASKDIRLLRALADGYLREDAAARMQRQPHASAYQQEAACVVKNEGTLDDARREVRACLQTSGLVKTDEPKTA